MVGNGQLKMCNYSIIIFFFFFFFFLISSLPLVLAQQPYIGQEITNCNNFDNSTSSSGYSCNGLARSCQAYLTFRAQPTYNTVSAISSLLGANPSELARLNSVNNSSEAAFETNRMVLVPVTCSCSGSYYQVNASYVVQPDDSYLFIANNTFQGLSTCQALQEQNSNLSTRNLYAGQRITVPLRCACPTSNQSDEGVQYLMSYLVSQSQFVSSISAIFGVDTGRTLVANGLSEQDAGIFPFTTLLVPLNDPPTNSEVTAPQPPPPPSTVNQPPPASPPGSGGGSSRSWIYAVVGVIGGLVLASVIGAAVYCLFCRRKKPETVVSSEKFESVEKALVKKDELEALGLDESLESVSTIAQSVKIYTFEELKTATENFSPDCLIKGSVYRGVINGDFAAIKKTNGDVSKEINLMNTINHFNLIRLSGVCFKEGHWYLVYEYASNGSLDDWIHNADKKKDINWNIRMQILLDVSTGLNYLHRYASPPYIHKDLNSSNVLLDQNFRAKVANFAMARSTEGEDGHFALTRHIVGTKGYMAPEYVENGLVSPKLDVYAFGVLMLEILTGNEVTVLLEEVGNAELSELLSSVLSGDEEREKMRDLVDSSLEGKYSPDVVVVMFRLIDSCLKKDPSDRPNMEEIVQTLSRISSSAPSGEWAIGISDYSTAHQ